MHLKFGKGFLFVRNGKAFYGCEFLGTLLKVIWPVLSSVSAQFSLSVFSHENSFTSHVQKPTRVGVGALCQPCLVAM